MTSLLRYYHHAAELPTAKGAYVLLVLLLRELVVTLPRSDAVALLPGRYLYCGSARGAGGLRARVGRHMRRDKILRWHIDRLTSAGRVMGCWVMPEGSECTFVAQLSDLPVPIPGFGSSDCPHCRSHLLFWPRGKSLPF